MSEKTIAIRVKAEADTNEAENALNRLQSLGTSLSKNISSGLQGMIFQGKSFEQTLKSIALNFSKQAFSAAFAPLEKQAGNLLGNLFSSITPFAKGGVFEGAQPFTFGQNLGVLGEAGPEAVMPLTRDASGRLGVRTSGGMGGGVTVNISTPDLQSFQRSQQQVSAGIARAVSRGQRSL